MPHWSRAILHVDMDAFYASVEQRDHPEYRGKPLIVAGSPRARGVVSAASYEVRPYGVHSAMPTGKALRLCPHVIVVPPDIHRYAEVSAVIFEIFARYTPLVQPVSLDEAFLDVTSSQRLFGDPVEIAKQIRAAIHQETALTASVGVSSCRLVAKIASDLNKPNGLAVIPPGEILDRLKDLPVGKIWGVGPVTSRKLERLGILTIGQLRAWPPEALEARLGSAGRELHELANGRDQSEVVPDEEEKSLSHETTFARDILDTEVLGIELRGLSDQVASRLRRRGLCGRVVFLKVRYDDFTTVTRRVTLGEATNLSEIINKQARRLLFDKTEAGRRPVRLIGVGVGRCEVRGERQGNLFDPPARLAKLERLEETADHIRDKLGAAAIQRASVKFHEEGGEE